MAQLDKDYFGLELVGDIRLFSEFYGAIELGNERKTQQSERINFTTSGTYLKLGFDYNMYKNSERNEQFHLFGNAFGEIAFTNRK